jgi:ZZ-type zinc finger-containing protein 3
MNEELNSSTQNDTSVNDEPFYFESDSLALRANPDYSCLLKSLVLLEVQRAKAIQDLEKLVDAKEKALENPLEFIEKLSRDESLELPTRQSIYLLPEIDWNKYYECVNISSEEFERTEGLLKASLRRQAKKTQPDPIENPKAASRQQQPQETQIIDEKKPINYNKAWDIEEQRRFEELLIEFPAEDNEAARWRKIAQKLGTRTPLQVQSHCQKYFIKLAKAGLPVPGRMPNLKTYGNKKSSRGNGRKGPGSRSQKRMIGRGISLENISSMWSSFNPPISMNDDDLTIEENTNNSNTISYQDGQFNDADDTSEDEEMNGSCDNINYTIKNEPSNFVE